MAEIFNDSGDEARPQYILHNMGEFDSTFYGSEENDDRTRLFQTIGRFFREQCKDLIFSYERSQGRIRQLKMDLKGVCIQLDDTTSDLRKQERRTRQLEQENHELIQQVSGLSVSLVNATAVRDRPTTNQRMIKVRAVLMSLFVFVVAYICYGMFT